MEKRFVVYSVVNKRNGKVYIGCTSQNPRKRWYRHLYDAKCGGSNTKFHNALRKDGKENFIFSVIDEAPTYQEMLCLEIYHIAAHNSFGKDGYNLTDGGEGASGHIPTSETLEKMRISSTGKKHTADAKLKVSMARRGKPHSKEHREKNRESKTKYSVSQYNKETGELIAIYESANHAARIIGVHSGNISRCCGGKSKFAYGFIWRYTDDHVLKISDEDLERANTEYSVSQYNKETGELIDNFQSASHAQSATGVCENSIISCCKKMTHHKSAGGFMWRYSSEDILKISDGDIEMTKNSASHIKHPVSQYNLVTGELIASYSSARHAERATGVHQSSICQCCKGKIKQSGGFLWKYTILPIII